MIAAFHKKQECSITIMEGIILEKYLMEPEMELVSIYLKMGMNSMEPGNKMNSSWE